MDAAKWNDWLTLTANIGVVIGLGMLIFELNHMTDLSEVEAFQTRSTEISDAAKELALSEDFAGIQERMAAQGFNALSPAEQRRVRAWELGVATRMQAQFYQYERGFLNETSYQAMLRFANASLPTWRELGIPIESAEFIEAAERVEGDPDRVL